MFMPFTEWIIPACAGNGRPMVTRPERGTGHPCVCGEQCEARRHKGNMLESSLRVRGTGLCRNDKAPERRVIPACAGEQTPDRGAGRCWCVSSPRVRGAVSTPVSRMPRPRVIPACAGNGAGAHTRLLHRPCHPCVCGEQTVNGWLSNDHAVSSLRVRGTASTGSRS